MNIPYKTLKAVSAAISKDESRYVLNGIEVMPRSNGIVLAATNGHVLIASYIEDQKHGIEKSFIFPRELLEMIKKPVEETVSICYSGNKITFENSNGIEISASPIDGIFPNWRKALNPDSPLVRCGVGAITETNAKVIFSAMRAINPGNKHNALSNTFSDGQPTSARFVSLDENTFAMYAPCRYNENREFAWPGWAKE